MAADINTYTERLRHICMLQITYRDFRTLILKCHIINGWIRLTTLEPTDLS